MAVYALVGTSGTIINRLVLDDPETWPLPEGHRLVEEVDTPFEIGAAIVDGVYMPLPAEVYTPSPEEVVESFRRAIQSHIDATAQARSYDSGTSLAGYVSSTNAAWAAEAQAFVAWRDAVWVYAYAELDKVTGGQREVPTVEGFIAELPAMVWPN